MDDITIANYGYDEIIIEAPIPNPEDDSINLQVYKAKVNKTIQIEEVFNIPQAYQEGDYNIIIKGQNGEPTFANSNEQGDVTKNVGSQTYSSSSLQTSYNQHLQHLLVQNSQHHTVSSLLCQYQS